MKKKIKSILTRDNLTSYVDKIFSSPQIVKTMKDLFKDNS